MMNTENPQNPDDLRKELEEENELLLTQLHLVQEELERYYLKCKELEQGSVSSAPHVNTALTAWVDDELPQALAETMRQKKLSEIQRELQQIEASNALPARLGNLLIQSADAGALASLPGKLLKIWRQSKQQAPDVLGGKEYKKVIETYEKEGFAATEKLLVTADVFATHKANAWTALARHLKGCNKAHVVLAARRAYAEDPKAYRLKWLAFRLRDNREYLEADALLDLLPADITFNDSESRLVSEIRYEAKTDRLRQAKKGSSYDARREAQNNQQKQLSNERDEQSRLAAERAREIETLLKKTKAQHAAAQQQLVERDSQLAAQQEALNRLDQDKTQLVAQRNTTQQLAAARLTEINELQQHIKKHQAEVADLSARQQLMHEEMVRAEAQLDLIKDVMLRESAL